MTSRSLQIGAAAGWFAFMGIVGALIVIPTVIAGQPPTAATPVADAMRYFGHPGFALLNALVSVFVAGIPIIPFGLGLRTMLRDSSDGQATFMADVGLLLLIVALPVYVVSGVIGGTLAATAGGDPAIFGPLHQFYQFLYNGAADVLEGAWIGAFAVAALIGGASRWISWLGIALAASRWVKALVPFGGVPDAIIPLSGLLFIGWFLATVVVLTIRARRPDVSAMAIATGTV